jgi:hypothetical protein
VKARKKQVEAAIEEKLPLPPDGGAEPEKRVEVQINWETLFETIGKQAVEIRRLHEIAFDQETRANELLGSNQELGGVVGRLTALLEHHGIDPTSPLPELHGL